MPSFRERLANRRVQLGIALAAGAAALVTSPVWGRPHIFGGAQTSPSKAPPLRSPATRRLFLPALMARLTTLTHP